MAHASVAVNGGVERIDTTLSQAEAGSNNAWKLFNFRFAVTEVSSDRMDHINYPVAGLL